MKKELSNLSPLQIIQNDIEEGIKKGNGRFALRIWEQKFNLKHPKIVSIIYEIERKRVRAGRRIFAKYESYNKKGRPCLSEIEAPRDNEEGRARIGGEVVKRKRSAESKINRFNEALEATENDMPKLKAGGGLKDKYILLSDSRKAKSLFEGTHDHAKKASAQRI